MTTKQRAKKLNKLLAEANAIQIEAKRSNGYDCFNFKSITILERLLRQIESAFSELSKKA